MTFLDIIVLALIQGFTELLPISSSAHVILTEKLMGLDPTSPEMTLLLVMLHTGTMAAVLLYYWKRWKKAFFQTKEQSLDSLKKLGWATLATVIFGYSLVILIENWALDGIPHAEIELIFGNTHLIALALGCVAILILFAGYWKGGQKEEKELVYLESFWIGLTQGLCLPFRGFSRSGATISSGIILGISKRSAEEFSFALAVVLTPPVLWREAHRFIQASQFENLSGGQIFQLFLPSFLGMVLSFGAGLAALRWLSAWIDKGRWGWFGFYCLAAALLVWFLG